MAPRNRSGPPQMPSLLFRGYLLSLPSFLAPRRRLPARPRVATGWEGWRRSALIRGVSICSAAGRSRILYSSVTSAEAHQPRACAL